MYLDNENLNNVSCAVFTVKELSQRWNLPISCVYNMIKMGAIPVINIPGGKRIPREFVYSKEEAAKFNPREPQTQREKILEQEALKLSQEVANLSQELDRKKKEIRQILASKNKTRV